MRKFNNVLLFVGLFLMGLYYASLGLEGSFQRINGVVGIVVLILLMVVAFEISIVIHEAGHLVFGLLTGFSFVSFRYRSFLIKKEEEKLVMHRYKMEGTGGQCLMMPDSLELSTGLYNAGGVLFNGIVLILVMLLYKVVPADSFIGLVLVVIGFVNVTIIFMNWIDMKGAFNDGRNYWSTKENPLSNEAMLLVLRANGLMSEGVLLSKIDLGDRDYKEYDVSDALGYNIISFRSEQVFNQGNMEYSFEMLEYLIENKIGFFIDDVIELTYYMLKLLVDEDFALSYYQDHQSSIEKGRKYIKSYPTHTLLEVIEDVVNEGVFDTAKMTQFERQCEVFHNPGSVNDNAVVLDLLMKKVALLDFNK